MKSGLPSAVSARRAAASLLSVCSRSPASFCESSALSAGSGSAV